MHWRSGHACASDEIPPSRERVALPLAPCSCWGARRWGFRAMRSREGGAGSADVLAIRTHNPRRFAVAPPRRAWGSTRSSTFAELPAEVQAGAVVALARHVRDGELHELHMLQLRALARRAVAERRRHAARRTRVGERVVRDIDFSRERPLFAKTSNACACFAIFFR